MTYAIRPIRPLSIPRQSARALLEEAEMMVEAPPTPGLRSTEVFPGVEAWAVGSGEAFAWALFVPEEYIEGGDENARSGRGTLMTKHRASVVLDVRDVESTGVFIIARAIRRALEA